MHSVCTFWCVRCTQSVTILWYALDNLCYFRLSLAHFASRDERNDGRMRMKRTAATTEAGAATLSYYYFPVCRNRSFTCLVLLRLLLRLLVLLMLQPLSREIQNLFSAFTLRLTTYAYSLCTTVKIVPATVNVAICSQYVYICMSQSWLQPHKLHSIICMHVLFHAYGYVCVCVCDYPLFPSASANSSCN